MAALHHAAVAGNTQMLVMLLENGAAVDLADNRGYRPIHFAAAHGRTEAVHLLLRWGSLPNAPAADGSAPLHLACQNGHVDVVSWSRREKGWNSVQDMLTKPVDYEQDVGGVVIRTSHVSKNVPASLPHG